MRMQENGRTITVLKEDLIEAIRKNKANHEVEYQKAVKAYKIEAKRLLTEELKELKEGSLQIKVSLVAPSNKTEEYDKIIKMFEWEVKEEVELSQGEFNQYVLDETSFALEARFANSTYLSLS